MAISINELSKAMSSLAEALNLYEKAASGSIEQKAFRDASIQRFEYSLELCWKVSMKLLGSATGAAKPALREMARSNLIKNPSDWIDFVDARNNTSHSYDEEVASAVFGRVRQFLPCGQQLIVELQKLAK
jgi:nucleotidyltransferase substrate binding protein (TIGR01987 family)